MKTGVIVAMRREYDALKRSGIASVTMSGIGKVNAAATAVEMILRDRPDCIINSGCAGSLKAVAEVMDVVIGAQCAYHDAWCGESNLPGQVEGEPQRFDADPQLLAAAQELEPATGRLHSGLICTGDQFFISLDEDRRILSLYPDGLASDMESAAIAQVCRHYGVPFLSFRTISDIHTGEDAQRRSYANFWSDIADNSFSLLARLLESI